LPADGAEVCALAENENATNAPAIASAFAADRGLLRIIEGRVQFGVLQCICICNIGRSAEKQVTLSAVSISSAKRATLVIPVLVCAAATGAAVLIYRWHRPMQTANAGTVPEILHQLPGDATVVAYIDVAVLRKLHDSPLAAMLGLVGENPSEDRDYQNFVRDTGFDYTRDLDRVAIAFWPSNLDTAQDGENNRTLAIADGRFDQAKIKAYALRTGKSVTVARRSLYLVPGNPPVALEFLSATRISLASGPAAEHILPVAAANPAPFDTPTQERIERVSGAPVFAVARTDKLPPSFYDSLRSVPQLQALARSVQALMLAGQPEGDAIDLTLDAECDSMTAAAELSTVVDGLRLFGSMALADPKTRRQMTKQQVAFLSALLNQAKLSHDDRWVRLRLDLTPAMMGQLSSSALFRYDGISLSGSPLTIPAEPTR
jgi:hypothetical protein